jgi:hypothetical protein
LLTIQGYKQCLARLFPLSGSFVFNKQRAWLLGERSGSFNKEKTTSRFTVVYIKCLCIQFANIVVEIWSECGGGERKG